MTAAEKSAKLIELHKKIADADLGRQQSDIPWMDPYWIICNTARTEISNLLATTTVEEVKMEEVPEIPVEVPVVEPEKTLKDKMNDLMAGSGGGGK